MKGRYVLGLAAFLFGMPACSLLFGWSDISGDAPASNVSEAGPSDATPRDATLDTAPDVAVAPIFVKANADLLERADPGVYDFELDNACILARVMMWGAGGGSVAPEKGGFGGYTAATWTLDQRYLRVVVGAANGGGSGGAANDAAKAGGGGGGHSLLTFALDGGVPVSLVAGGGGGACFQSAGGSGGGPQGDNGVNELAGYGGGSNQGGAGGAVRNQEPDARAGLAGSALTGGPGGGAASLGSGGGGGGSGYFGGGGGASMALTTECGGGGGGSGFVDPYFKTGETHAQSNGKIANDDEPHRVARLAGEPGHHGMLLLFCGSACASSAECGASSHCFDGTCHPNAKGSPCEKDAECGGFTCSSQKCG